MNAPRYLLLLAAVLCSGCAGLTHADKSNLQAHGVAPDLEHKMARIAPLTLPEIVELSHRGLLPEYIIQYLHATHQIYNLSDSDGYSLNHQGVNPTVVAYLFATPDLMARASDRTRFFDWSPYYVPFYGGMMNTFADETFGAEKSYMSSGGSVADSTIEKQQQQEQKILGADPTKQPPQPAPPPVQPLDPPQH